MFKVNNKNTRTTSFGQSGVLIVNSELMAHLFLVFLLLIKYCFKDMLLEWLINLKDPVLLFSESIHYFISNSFKFSISTVI